MSLSAAFAPLLRALTGGRFGASSRPRHSAGPLPPDPQWDALLAELRLPPTALNDVVAAGSLHPHFHYRHYGRRKKGGGRREIVEPDVKLKRLQRSVLDRHLAAEEPHPAAVAYRKGASIARHVWPHAGAAVVIAADVQDFFPNTSEGRIEDWWRVRVDGSTARLLTLLTAYRGGLPQGAPTSPALSNLVNLELDERLARRAAACGAHYTRYCDDMVFSWRSGGPPSDFEAGVRAALHAFGYALHPVKGWRVYEAGDEPEITGLVLTTRGRVRLPEEIKQKMRALSRSDDPRDAERLAGYRGYEAMVVKRPARTRPRRTSRPAPPRPAPSNDEPF